MVSTRSQRVKDEAADRAEAQVAATPVKCFSQCHVKEDAVSPYESLRLSRIAENQARMAALGVKGKAAGLAAFFKVTRTSSMAARKPVQLALFTRRSERIRCKTPAIMLDVDEDVRLRSKKTNRLSALATPNNDDLKILEISPVLMAQRCNSRGRGSLYDAIIGICCHFCRQKKLCGEEDCERCGNRDISKPCQGKTNCSKCNSAIGIFCRACLKVRYGEELEDVKRNPKWMCPHCFEAEGLDPFWICNSSICLTRRKLLPTGIAIFEARLQGFESVAHYLRDKLKKREGKGLSRGL
ncbi:hypothetical protein O6H91_08G049600 [Diphasiastrum complanatum]|uniref:Uncharacterized protein n=1 Tax=Diphasiastrum complanatum TaxID=34168 RepID=A0ACC2CXS2_DIPCM|nr:hypothetical protein O6H91_Y518200 [Diphasiastrum complanatum]KAJ7546665.1 hypothetical protein O6H91_08G049600 [Diphasiastrum complanatum]